MSAADQANVDEERKQKSNFYRHETKKQQNTVEDGIDDPEVNSARPKPNPS